MQSFKGSEITAYDIASIEGHFEVCEEMQKHGYQALAPPTEVIKPSTKQFPN